MLTIANVLLLSPLVFFYKMPPIVAILAFCLVFLAALTLSTVVRRLDPDSIISLRRAVGLLVVSTFVWAVFGIAGTVYQTLTKSQPNLGEFVLGGFLAWSFDTVVVNGAFLQDTRQSLSLAAIHPTPLLILALVSVAQPEPAIVYAAVGGLVLLAATIIFLSKFKSYETEGMGINSLQIFQSFLKTWVTQKPSSLEQYFALYSRDEPVVTSVLLARAKGQAAVVLPGVHPGPFFPVGSYNISELIYHELRRDEFVPMVLHGTGGHEKNLPTNLLAQDYARQVAATAISAGGDEIHTMKGPIRSRIGITDITMLEFGNQVIAFISSAPYNTDDLDPKIIDDALSAAKAIGLRLMLVDTHNSIGGENAEPTQINAEQWRDILTTVTEDQDKSFEVAVAHSSEADFDHASDISEGGIGVLLFRKGESKYALVSVDSNNAIIGLRQRVSDELKQDGIQLIDLCTSDTHNSAARGLVNRGYYALGEATSQEKIIAVIRQLAKAATENLSYGAVVATESQTSLPLIGAKSLHDFAVLTDRTLKYIKASAKAMAVLIATLFLVTLFY